MSKSTLKSHGDALYSLLLKPIVNSSPAWKKAAGNIQQLADCLIAYSKHLDVQLETQNSNQSLDHPVRTIGEHTTVENRQAGETVKDKYLLLDQAVIEAGLSTPVHFDEANHLAKPFENATERFRFFKELQLTVSVDILRYCPGGAYLTTVCIVQVPNGRSESEILIDGARLLQRIRPQLKEFHTRAQKAAFKEKVNNKTQISPAVREFIYRYLTGDSSAPFHPVMQQRLRLIWVKLAL